MKSCIIFSRKALDGLCNWYMQEHNTGSIWKSSASKKKGGRTWMFSLVIREAWEELQKKQTKESKEFMKPVITPSGEDYLETILVLHKKMGMVRSVDVARHMGVSKPSVCVAVNTLKDGGFLIMDEDHLLHLTDVGREVAEKIYERHCFFTEQLIAAGVDPETAEVDAFRIEHVISNESFERLKKAAFRNQENEISALSKEIKDKPTE